MPTQRVFKKVETEEEARSRHLDRTHEIRKRRRTTRLQRRRQIASTSADRSAALAAIQQAVEQSNVAQIQQHVGADEGLPAHIILTDETLAARVVALCVTGAAMDLLTTLVTAPTFPRAENDYYGPRSMRWTDLCIPHSAHLLNNLPATSTIWVASLVDDTSRVLPLVREQWPILVQGLPQTADLCTTVACLDVTPYHIDTDRLLQLYDSSLEQALPLTEALTRRGSVEASVVQRVVSVVVSMTSNRPVLEAALDTLRNLVGTALLSVLTPEGVQSVARLSNDYLEAVGLVGDILSLTEVPALVPPLVAILVDERRTLAWTKSAAHGLVQALVWTSHKTDLLQQFVAPQARGVVQTVVDLLGRPDYDAIVDALSLTEYLLEWMPESRRMFEEYNVVEQLNNVRGDDVERHAESIMAEFFGDDEEDETPLPASFSLEVPVPQEGPFDFGSTTVASVGRGRGRVTPAWMK